jgi:predicted nucleic acid-binding protein
MRLYLDNCCLNRPFDDQTIPKNRVEAEAVLSILDEIARGAHILVGSDAVVLEVNQNPDVEKAERVRAFISLQGDHVSATPEVETRMRALVGLGLKALDALHVACAEAGRCDVFLTTDEQLLRRARRNSADIRVEVDNPAAWVLR